MISESRGSSLPRGAERQIVEKTAWHAHEVANTLDRLRSLLSRALGTVRHLVEAAEESTGERPGRAAAKEDNAGAGDAGGAKQGDAPQLGDDHLGEGAGRSGVHLMHPSHYSGPDVLLDAASIPAAKTWFQTSEGEGDGGKEGDEAPAQTASADSSARLLESSLQRVQSGVQAELAFVCKKCTVFPQRHVSP